MALCVAVAVSGLPAAASAASSIYVTNLSTNGAGGVFQYDAGTDGTLTAKAAVAVNAGLGPRGIAISPDGRSVYVTNGVGAAGVSQYDVGPNGSLTPKVPAIVNAGADPIAVAISPDGRSVYVANNNTNGAGGISQYNVTVADGTLTPKTPATVAGGNQPWGIAVNPDGRSVYMANRNTTGAGGISQYDVAVDGSLTPKTTATVPGGNQPAAGVAASPDGLSVYVTNINTNGAGGVSQYSAGVADGSLTPKVPATVAASNMPYGVAVSPDGHSVYVTNAATNGAGGISQYDVAPDGSLSPKAAPTVLGGNGPTGIAVSPDGRNAYVANSGTHGAGGVSQYDVGLDGSLTPKLAAAAGGNGPIEIAASPAHSPTPVFSVTPAAAGAVTAFNASGSSSVGGTIRRYDWTFGDGQVANDAGPIPSHRYAAAGSVTATLLVFDGCPSVSFVFTGRMASCVGPPTASISRTFTIPSPPVVSGPAIRSLRLSPSTFKAAVKGPTVVAAGKLRRSVGTKVIFVLKQAASAKFTLAQFQTGRKASGGRCVKPVKANRKAHRCTRLVVMPGGFTRTGRAGANRFGFTGRWRGRKLNVARYQLVATPKSGGKTGRALKVVFRIIN